MKKTVISVALIFIVALMAACANEEKKWGNGGAAAEPAQGMEMQSSEATTKWEKKDSKTDWGSDKNY